MPEINGDVIEINDFIECCKDGGFIDDDGFGEYCDAHGNLMICDCDMWIHPSEVRKGNIDKSYTHIMWYNK